MRHEKFKPSRLNFKELDRDIRHLQVEDLYNFSVQELKSLFFPIIKKLKGLHYKIKPLCLYRGRLNEGFDSFENAEDLWYPPSENVKSIGRCNDIQESMFYGTCKPETTIFELKFRVRDILTLMSAENGESDFNMFAIGVSHPQKANPQFKVNVLNGSTPYQEEDVRSIDAFLHKIFIKTVNGDDQAHYKITTAITQLLLEDPNVDGLTFGSAAHKSEGVNFVLKPSAADRHLRPGKAFEVQIIDELPDNEYRCKIIRISSTINENGKFIWEDPSGKISVVQQIPPLFLI